MKHVGKKSVSFAMEIILVLLMVVNAAVLIFLPKVITFYLEHDYNILDVFSTEKTILLAILYPCGLSALIVEFSLFKIFRTLVDGDPFVQSNVRYLNVMGTAMIVVTAFLIAKIFLLNSIMTMLGGLASGLLAVFCFVLADVFQQAVYYKQDNELTI
ncbi:MAG: DUF2975 domain-containing protein [Clostridia bacterium]|nr:DUF2975 domain-containing protein [Clostridia bacterium]